MRSLTIEPLSGIAAEHGPAMAERVMVETGKRLRVVHSDCNGVARHGEGFAVLIADFRRPMLWGTRGALRSVVAARGRPAE